LSAHASHGLIAELRAAASRTRIIALTHSPSPALIQEILAAGALGCLTKDCASQELMTAIRTAHAGKIYLSPSIAQAVVSGYVLQGKPASKIVGLTAREKQILRLIADGTNTKQIAATIGVSVKTIETHRRRMMKKAGAHSVAELTKYAVREGITSLEPRS
jgi:DNA-binding NarL/FixJ family response regulator